MPIDNVKVSIICLTYNHECYIESCLNGFLMQKTNFNFEVVVHDDCSTDNTQTIIRKFEEREPLRIKALFEKENQYSRGTNIIGDLMMPVANGEYIAFCEGDDVWIDDSKLTRQVDYLDNHPEYIACVHNTLFHRCDKRCKDFPMFLYDSDRDLEFEDLFKWNAFGYQYSSLLVRRSFFENPPFGYGEFPMALFLSLNGKIRFLARTMSEYRFRSSNHSTRANVFSKGKVINEMNGYIEDLIKIRDYLDSGTRKQLITNRIIETKNSLENLCRMTDSDYAKQLIKNEKVFDIKLFIRSHFRFIYKFLINHRNKK